MKHHEGTMERKLRQNRKISKTQSAFIVKKTSGVITSRKSQLDFVFLSKNGNRFPLMFHGKDETYRKNFLPPERKERVSANRIATASQLLDGILGAKILKLSGRM